MAMACMAGAMMVDRVVNTKTKVSMEVRRMHLGILSFGDLTGRKKRIVWKICPEVHASAYAGACRATITSAEVQQYRD